MGDALENHDFVLEVSIGQAERLAEALHQSRVRRFLNEQFDELIVRRRIAGVFDHAESKAFVDRVIGQIVLERKAPEPFLGKLTFAQLAKIARAHQALDARPDYSLQHRFNKCFVPHKAPRTIGPTHRNILRAEKACQG
jgi:hypothetical protein